MSDTDSFIDEVTEEVKRDRLFALIKRYGWIAVIVVIALVGGTAWVEYQKAQQRAAAQALGDSILGILEEGEEASKPIALSEIPASADAKPVVDLLVTMTQLANDNPQAAVDLLTPMASDQSISVAYRDLAAFKLATLPSDSVSRDTRRTLLEQIVIPGAPYRLLGMEQQILMQIEDGQNDEAIAAATSLLQETGVSVGLQQRLVQLIVALGGDVSALGDGTGDQ